LKAAAGSRWAAADSAPAQRKQRVADKRGYRWLVFGI